MIESDEDDFGFGVGKSKVKNKLKRTKVKSAKSLKNNRKRSEVLSETESEEQNHVSIDCEDLLLKETKETSIGLIFGSTSSATKNHLLKITEDEIHLPSPPIGFAGATGRLNVPLHQNRPLDWSYPVQLLGEKISIDRLHKCQTCDRLIAKYGRLLPCKHVLCEECAMKLGCPGTCSQCSKKVLKIEKVRFPAVYLCSQAQCGRAYLSARDLAAHVQHRHVKKERKPLESNNSSLSTSLSAKRKESTLAASLQELSKQAAQQQRSHAHHGSLYPPPSLHTIQWTAAVAASTSASLQAKANSVSAKNSKTQAWLASNQNPFVRF